ncbi:MAG: Re/Si-specific NAD(P)(+) transhydrogenase subunit alpha [Planctomycetes bacterium]|nr:Re/Si-specific NAD(P)(+) transhydrogenase subunit alpha [Planctomycetota bacterium]
MIVGVPMETVAGERRVALVPDLVAMLKKAGLDVVVQTGAGTAAGFLDAAYEEKGARISASVLPEADIVVKVQPPSLDEVGLLREDAVLIALLQPYSQFDALSALAARRVTSFAMELMPRITRAQPMDALSAMSTVAGYKAVLLAASRLPKFFPLLMTAAGTLTPAKVFILGAGVAGLQAIGTARRLGAVVEAFDTRPAVKEQVESLGARFVELPLDTKNAEGKGGYAKEQTDEFLRKQQELLTKSVAAADVVITTALVPGKKAPTLITAAMVQAMRPGSVIVDLAAEQGGNCELTQPGQETVQHGVTIVGFTNLPSTLAFHASSMLARTFVNFLLIMVKDGKLNLNLDDDVIRGPLATHQGQIVHDAIKTAMAAASRAP